MIYICPVCGNIIYSAGEAVISCHGINLSALEAEDSNNLHKITIEKVEDEYVVSIHHEMMKHFSIVIEMGCFGKKGECLPCNLNMNENLHCFTVLHYNLVTGTLIGFHFC